MRVRLDCGSISSHLLGLLHDSLLLDLFLKALTRQPLDVVTAAGLERSRSLQHTQPLLPPTPSLLPVSHLILLLLHFSQQELGIDVALLQQVLQPLEAHVIGVPLPGLASLEGGGHTGL